ncbi:hypothetical protein [Rathayibacter sp. VKM Ac-2630]|uniref:hypothetical protein n=1 Tax=Rathayibacter sp. VKM Ac-2630 TaxID=1938617 RepID=UPI003158F877
MRGTEVAVGVLDLGDGPTALPVVEIEPISGPYTFDARYTAGETRFYVPARVTSEALSAVSEAAVAIHRLLGLRDLSRIDFVISADGQPWFFDANVIPGLTETSLVPQPSKPPAVISATSIRPWPIRLSRRIHTGLNQPSDRFT